jgi:hypothetical protein
MTNDVGKKMEEGILFRSPRETRGLLGFILVEL